MRQMLWLLLDCEVLFEPTATYLLEVVHTTTLNAINRAATALLQRLETAFAGTAIKAWVSPYALATCCPLN